MGQKLGKKAHSLMNDKKFVKELKFWIVMAMIIVFGFVTQVMINRQEIEYMVACGGLLILDMIIFRLIEEQYMKIVLKEIIEVNNSNQMSMKQLRYNFNSIIKDEYELYRIAIKYERCWRLLKKGCEMSNNTDLGNYLNNLEKSIEPEVNKEIDKICKKMEI